MNAKIKSLAIRRLAQTALIAAIAMIVATSGFGDQPAKKQSIEVKELHPQKMRAKEPDVTIMIPRHSIAAQGHLLTLAFSPDASQIAGVGWLRTRENDWRRQVWAKIWDAATGKEKVAIQFEDNSRKEMACAAFSPYGRWLATGIGSAGLDLPPRNEQSLRLWDTATGKENKSFQGYTGGVLTVEFSPDEKRIVSVCEDGSIRVWDAATGKESLCIQRPLDKSDFDHSMPHNFYPYASYSPDGRRIIDRRANYATVWDATTGEEVLALPLARCPSVLRCYGAMAGFLSDGRIWTTAVLHPDQKLAAGCVLEVWDAETRKPISRIGVSDVYRENVSGRVIKPISDGRRIVFFGLLDNTMDHALQVYDGATGRQTHELKLPILSVPGSMAFGNVLLSPGGRRVAYFGVHQRDPTGRIAPFANVDYAVRIWHLPLPSEPRNKSG